MESNAPLTVETAREVLRQLPNKPESLEKAERLEHLEKPVCNAAVERAGCCDGA